MAGRAPESCAGLAAVAAALADGDTDAAIDAGLMAIDRDAIGDPAMRATISTAQDGLRAAWDARERFRARELRLARRAAEREAARRAPGTTGPSPDTAVAPGEAPSPAGPTRPALPAAAAAALARARAKAAARRP